MFVCLFKSSYLTWSPVCVVLISQMLWWKTVPSGKHLMKKNPNLFFHVLFNSHWLSNKYMYMSEQMLQKCNYYKQHEWEIQINGLFNMNSFCQFRKEKIVVELFIILLCSCSLKLQQGSFFSFIVVNKEHNLQNSI